MGFLPTDLLNTATTTVVTSAITTTSTSFTVASGSKFTDSGAFMVRLGASSGRGAEIAQVTIRGAVMTFSARGLFNTQKQAWLTGTTVQWIKHANEDDLFEAVTYLLSQVGTLTAEQALDEPAALVGNAAQTIATSGTIATAALGISRVTSAGNVTAVVLQPGTVDGQVVIVENSGGHSVTFDVAGTSNVADGASTVIATLTAVMYEWNATAALWYAVK